MQTCLKTNKSDLLAFLGKNSKLFAKDLTELGKTTLVEHRIETGNAKPVSSSCYMKTPPQREITEKITKEMLGRGIIEESSSSWHSPVDLVKKKLLPTSGI